MRARLMMSSAGLALLVALGGVAHPGPAVASPAQAGGVVVDAGRVQRLTDLMQLAPLLAVMREEGLAYGDALDRDLLAGTGGVNWRAAVARVYDPHLARRQIEASLLASLSADPQVLLALENFYSGPLGQKVAGLEVDARRALLDPSAKDIAQRAWDDLSKTDGRRADQLKALVDGQGLIEQNVQGTLTANLALYRGLRDGGGLKEPLADDQAAAQVADQEAQVRAAAQAWLYPYLTLAYQSLSDQELDQYLAFLATPEGTRANQAMFQAFDTLYTRLSHDLGLAAAHRLAGEEI